eukprot:2312506-Rhodomonas_salina.3
MQCPVLTSRTVLHICYAVSGTDSYCARARERGRGRREGGRRASEACTRLSLRDPSSESRAGETVLCRSPVLQSLVLRRDRACCDVTIAPVVTALPPHPGHVPLAKGHKAGSWKWVVSVVLPELENAQSRCTDLAGKRTSCWRRYWTVVRQSGSLPYTLPATCYALPMRCPASVLYWRERGRERGRVRAERRRRERGWWSGGGRGKRGHGVCRSGAYYRRALSLSLLRAVRYWPSVLSSGCVLWVCYGCVLRGCATGVVCYALSGTGLACGLVWSYRYRPMRFFSGTGLAYDATVIVLRVCYAMPGTNLAYAWGTRS